MGTNYNVSAHVTLFDGDGDGGFSRYLDYWGSFDVTGVSTDELNYVLTSIYKENSYEVEWNGIRVSADGKAFRWSGENAEGEPRAILIILRTTDKYGVEHLFNNQFLLINE